MSSSPSTPERPGVNTVFVGGISWKADEASLKEFFMRLGPVLECKIITDRGTGKSKGYGFVTFHDAETAEIVKKSTDLFFLGKMMNVGDAYRKAEPAKRSPSSSPPSTPDVASLSPPFSPAPAPQTHLSAMYQYYGYQPYPYYNLGPEHFQYGYPTTVYGYPVMYDQQPVYPFGWSGAASEALLPPQMYPMSPVDDLALAVGPMGLDTCPPGAMMRPAPPVLASR